MELTPTVLIGIGETPAAALTRFKQDALWRPAPVRGLVRALFVGTPAPAAATVLQGLAQSWVAPECTWLPDIADLKDALRKAQAETLSAANLEAVRALPGYTVRIREYQESFAPEACILADATAPGPLRDVLQTAFGVYGRPATLVLTLPAPYAESWAGARDLVRRLAEGPEAALLERIWLVSREQETGEVLEQVDLADALSLFCDLFACSGWLSEPDWRPFFIREVTDGAGVPLATFGVRGCRFSAPHHVQGRILADAERTTGQLLDDHGATVFDLDEFLSRGRDLARTRAPEAPMPAPGDLSAERWYARAKLRWAPEADRAVESAIASALEPLVSAVSRPLTEPGRQGASCRALAAAIRRYQGETDRPAAPPDVTAAFERLADLRRLDRWWPLGVKAILSVIMAGALAWSFFPAGSTTVAALITGMGWAVALGVLIALNLKERRQALQELHGALLGWAGARVEGMIYSETLQQLQGLAQAAETAVTAAEAAVERLKAARVFLAEEKAHPALPPARTALVSPCQGTWPVDLGEIDPAALVAAAPAEAARQLLERPWRGAPILLGASAEPTPYQQEFVEGRPVQLLLPVRAIQPSDGEPLRQGSLVLSSGSPFLWARFVLTRPFGLPGSPRLELRAGVSACG